MGVAAEESHLKAEILLQCHKDSFCFQVPGLIFDSATVKSKQRDGSPFNISSTITIAGATRAAIRKAQDLKHGQSQTHALAHELSDLTIILLELEKCLRSGQSRQNPQFLQSLVTVRTKLNSLAENITSWVAGFAPSSEQQDERRFRWLRAGGKAKSFKDDLSV